MTGENVTAKRDGSPVWTGLLPLCFAAVLALFALAGALQSDRPLWQDESAVLVNLGLDWSVYFGPLPYYDQAGPPLALIVQDMFLRLAGGDVPLPCEADEDGVT